MIGNCQRPQQALVASPFRGMTAGIPPPAELDDYEPIEWEHWYHALWGHHNIGPEDKGWPHLALLFDAGWIPEHDVGGAVVRHLLGVLSGLEVRCIQCCDYRSPEISADELFDTFSEHVRLVRAFDYPCEQPLYVIALTTPPTNVDTLLAAAAAYPPYVGHGSRPSTRCNFLCGHRAPWSGGLRCNL